VLNIWIGATAEPQTTYLLVGVAALIAFASCLQAALGAWLLRRLSSCCAYQLQTCAASRAYEW
jgi:hypothetical protein